MAAENDTDHGIEKIWTTITELEFFSKMKTKFQKSDGSFHRALAVAKNSLLSVFQASFIDVLFNFIDNIDWQKEHKKHILFHHRRIAEDVAKRNPEDTRETMLEKFEDMQRIRILSKVPVTKGIKWIKKYEMPPIKIKALRKKFYQPNECFLIFAEEGGDRKLGK